MFEFLKTESGIRLACFAGILLLMAILEVVAPRRTRDVKPHIHWPNNLGLAVFNAVAMRLVAPLGAVGFSIYVDSVQWGLFHVVEIPLWLMIVVCIVALDLAVYGQHVLFHAVPIFWQVHKVHHTDTEFDVTTGLRFHTLEILLSLGIKCIAILFLGAPAIAVLAFEILLNATAMFNHANIRLPFWLDRSLRIFVVTPDMHRVHHSVLRKETNSNFGFNLTWWDFLFGTYRDQPENGHVNMTIGLPEFRESRSKYFHWMLAIPFIRSSPVTPVADELEQIQESENQNRANQ